MKKCKECGFILPDNFKNDICGECKSKMQKKTAKKVSLKPTITITGCTDKTCGDCDYWKEELCALFFVETKECKDKKYQLINSDGDKYNDFYRCKKCLEAECK